jgi:hypothetical protein
VQATGTAGGYDFPEINQQEDKNEFRTLQQLSIDFILQNRLTKDNNRAII